MSHVHILLGIRNKQGLIDHWWAEKPSRVEAMLSTSGTSWEGESGNKEV
jgi:hypothetical protein